MSEQVAVGLLFLFLLCIAEPILLGMRAHKIYDRVGAFWGFGLLAFGMNIGILVFLESHLGASSLFDTATQVGIVMSLSAMSILAALELLRKGPEAPTQETSAINLRRGLFRIWAIMGGAWIVFCAIEYLDCTTRY